MTKPTPPRRRCAGCEAVEQSKRDDGTVVYLGWASKHSGFPFEPQARVLLCQRCNPNRPKPVTPEAA